MYIRMQPCDARVPMEDEIGVPCMPMPGADVPIQRVPSGLFTPGGIGPRPAAHGELGGNHVGFTCFWMTEKLPVGVGYAGWPTATGKLSLRLPLYQVSRNAPRSITTIAPTDVLAGMSRFDGRA